MKPISKGTFYKVKLYTIHGTISIFLQAINNLVDYNVKVASKLINDKKTNRILYFITLLDTLVE